MEDWKPIRAEEAETNEKQFTDLLFGDLEEFASDVSYERIIEQIGGKRG